MASSSNQPRSEVGQLVYLAIVRDGDTLNCEAIVANVSGGRRILALGSSVLDPGTGAFFTSETLAEGEGASVHKTGRVPVCFLSSACRKVLVAPRKSWGSNTVDVELGIAIMSVTQLRRRDNLGAEFPVHQNASMKSVAESKKSKRAKHGRAALAKADSSGSQSAAESEDSNGGEELGVELSEALKERARFPQAGKADGKQLQKQPKTERLTASRRRSMLLLLKKKKSSEKKKKSKKKRKEKRCEGSELLGKKDRPGKKGRGRGRGKGEKAEKE